MSSQANENPAFTFTKTYRNDTYPAVSVKPTSHAGKIVFVTGASRGIGRAIAVAFAQAGVAGLVITARTIAGLQGTFDEIQQVMNGAVAVLPLALDISDAGSVAAAAEALRECFGRLDVLVNNAAYFEDPALIGESDPREWWKVWEVNVLGTYLVTRALLPILLEGGDKTVLNVSTVATMLQVSGVSAYGASKFAYLKLTESLVLEYEGKGLLTYSVHPGTVATEMAVKLPGHMQHLITDTPELAAHTLVWLTRERKEWLSGRWVNSNWDMAELEGLKGDIVERDLLKMKMTV